jgi:hypothetical protein
MTRLPRSPGSTLVLWLNQETVHDFILLFMPPCSPHLTPLATGSLERSLIVFSTPGGLTGDDLSCLFFTCTNTSQAATCTCNTWPRISPHNVVNHSSHKEATIHWSSNHTWSSPWRGRACLSHDCGPRTPPRAQGLAAGQPSCMCGRPRRAGAPRQPLFLSSSSPRGEKC